MFKSESKVRVRYGETDRMGYCYYGNYATFFEVARVEAIKKIGFSYRQMEDEGIALPVLDYQVKFYKPAFYDDEIVIFTTISEMPGARIKFDYQCYRGEDLLNEASTTLVFVNMETGRPRQAPEDFIQKIAAYF
ncbi:MAG: acyl-CoA thioesterase [Flavobacteriales bacterium]|nr:acyl-CoA thioesterase [Flavobacteriales bacterium]